MPRSTITNHAIRAGILAAALAVPMTAAPAVAATADGETFRADLNPVPLNGQDGASGSYTVTLDGDRATITGQVSGLAATFNDNPYPHVQHIHGLAKGRCPTAAADSDGDGVVSTPEGRPAYGSVQTTLSVTGPTAASAATNLKIAPSGSSFRYERTITLNDDTQQALRNGNAVIVVHGLDPATAPAAATEQDSPLVPTLPLAATAPALCGALVTSSPAGAAAAGAGGTAGVEQLPLLAAGGVLLAAGTTVVLRRAGRRC